MADVAAQLTVVIDAIDNASGVIAGVAAELGGLGSIGNTAAGSTAAVNSALDNTARSGTAAGSALTAAARGGTTLVQSQERVISTAEKWKTSGKNLKEFGEGVDTLTKPLQAAAVAAVGLGIATGKAAVDFEDNFAAVEKTVDGTPEQLENIKQGIIDMTTAGINGHKAIPLATADLTELAAAGGQLGIETENILDFTETMAMLGTATNLSGEAGAQTLARFMNVTNTAQSDVKRLGSTIVDLGNNFATTEAEIANMAMDMGATGSEIGMSTQDILGYATALSSMGIEAAAGGSALQRIWMDMQNAVSSGGDSLEAFAKISGKSSKGFQEQWKKDASGAFRDFLKGLNESEDKVGLLTALGFNNVRDQRALMALAGEEGFNILTEAINRANKAWNENTALQNEFDKKAETTKSQIEVTKNNVIEAARSFGEVLLPEVAAVTGGIADFAKGLADMDEGSKKAVITGAKGAIILGAASKGFVSAVKGAGAMHEAIGKVAETAPKVGAAIASGIASPIGIAGAALLATGGIWLGLMSNLDKGTEVNENFGGSVKGISKEFQDLNDKLYEDNQKLQEYQDITNKLNSGQLKGDEKNKALERQAELQNQIVESYGSYISQQEKANGVTSKTIASIQKRNDLELERKQLEYESSLIGVQDDYAASQKRIGEINSQIKINEENRLSAQAMADAYLEYGNALEKIENDESLTSKQRKEKIAELKEAYAGLVTTDSDKSESAYEASERHQKQANANFNNIIELSKELNNLKTQQNETQTAALNLANVYADKLPEAIMRADGSADNMIKTLIRTTKGLGVDNEISQQIAIVKNGFEDLQSAIDNGALGAVLNDYAVLGKKFGMTSSEIAAGQSLLQNGFTSVYDAMFAGDKAFNAVQSQFKGLAVDAGATNDELTKAAHQFGLLDESYSMERITANGENIVNTLNEAGKVVESFNANQGINIRVNEDTGGIDILNNLGETLKSFKDLGAVELKVNVDTGGIDVYGKDGLKLGEITAEGKITWKSEEPPEPDVPDAEGTVNYETGEVEKPEDLTVEGTVNWTIAGTEMTQMPTFDKWLKQNTDTNTTITPTVTVDATILNTKGEKKGSGSILDWLFPSASAAELDDTSVTGQTATITQDITVVPGSIDVEAVTSTLTQAMDLVGAMETSEVNATVSVTVTPGSIDVSALTSTMSQAIALVGAMETSSVNATVNVTVVPGNVDTSALSGAVENAVAGISSATVTADVELTGAFTYSAEFEAATAPELTGTVTYSADFSGIGSPPTLEGTVVYHAVYEKQAQGTQNFGGGLAMLNDETGVADKRELVIDQGRAFIPQGENVIMALSKGAKVYTASQTKRIMASLGIAQYASGKDNDDLLGTLAQFGLSGITVQKSLPENVRTHEEYLYEWKNGGSMAGAPNSETFEEAKEEWEHYKRTHALTISEEMQKQIEFAHEFNETEADIADIEEEIFSLARKTSEELNEQSKSYIVDRSALNDWEAYGDSAIAAFDRVRDRNLQDYHDGLITWQEYTENMSDIGSAMYDERREQSEDWLDHEEKYNGMSAADYIAGIDRMQQYTQEYYDNGIITYREFVEAKTDLDEQRLDKYKELLDEQFNISKDYISEHTYFNDWGDLGDDPLAAYNSVKEHMDAALASGKLTEEEYKEYMSGLGTEMYDWRREQSGNWLDEQRKYFGMEADAYIEGLEREKIYTEKYYRLGLINRREFNEGMTDLNHKMWDEAAAAYDDMLDKQSEYISDLREQFSDEEQALRDSWEVEDRAVDMSEVAEQLAIYEGAVTDRGQQKYKDLQEELLQLQRDEELYNLQVKNNAIIESLEAEYEQLESDKTAYLKGIAENTNIDISGIVSDITSGIEQSGNGITHTLSEIIDAIHGIKMEQQNYTDSRQINITTSDAAVMSRFMGAM